MIYLYCCIYHPSFDIPALDLRTRGARESKPMWTSRACVPAGNLQYDTRDLIESPSSYRGDCLGSQGREKPCCLPVGIRARIEVWCGHWRGCLERSHSTGVRMFVLYVTRVPCASCLVVRAWRPTRRLYNHCNVALSTWWAYCLVGSSLHTVITVLPNGQPPTRAWGGGITPPWHGYWYA